MKGGGPVPGAAATPGPVPTPRQPRDPCPTCLHPPPLRQPACPPSTQFFPSSLPAPRPSRCSFLQQRTLYLPFLTASLQPVFVSCSRLPPAFIRNAIHLLPLVIPHSAPLLYLHHGGVVTMSHFSAVVHCHSHYGGGRLPSATRPPAHHYSSSSSSSCCTPAHRLISAASLGSKSLGRRWVGRSESPLSQVTHSCRDPRVEQ